MHTFEFIRPERSRSGGCHRRSGEDRAAGRGRALPRRRDDARRSDEAERRNARAAHRHQPPAARQDRSHAGRRAEDRRHCSEFGSRPPPDRATRLRGACRRRSSPALRRSSATWRRPPATCCSERAACISATPPCPATSASRAPVARRSPAATARSRSSARASIASRPTRPTCAWRWRRWKRRFTCRGRRATRAIPIGEFHLLPGDTPHRETVLEPGDLITHVTLPPPASRERASRSI